MVHWARISPPVQQVERAKIERHATCFRERRTSVARLFGCVDSGQHVKFGIASPDPCSQASRARKSAAPNFTNGKWGEAQQVGSLNDICWRTSFAVGVDEPEPPQGSLRRLVGWMMTCEELAQPALPPRVRSKAMTPGLAAKLPELRNFPTG